jgi:hypothetical protein
MKIHVKFKCWYESASCCFLAGVGVVGGGRQCCSGCNNGGQEMMFEW